MAQKVYKTKRLRTHQLRLVLIYFQYKLKFERSGFTTLKDFSKNEENNFNVRFFRRIFLNNLNQMTVAYLNLAKPDDSYLININFI